MKEKKALVNERGAALLMTLFLVMFVSIVGVVLLNTTFYGQKNNIAAIADQQEFYRLEGAIDLMIYDMETFLYNTGRYLKYEDNTDVLGADGKPIQIIESGPYYYLKNNQPKGKRFTIDGENILVTIEEITHDNSFGPNYKKYEYTLVSKYEATPHLKREITMTSIVETKSAVLPVSYENDKGEPIPTKPGFPGNLGDNIISITPHGINSNRTDWIKATSQAPANVFLRNFFTYYKLDTSKIAAVTTNWSSGNNSTDEKRYFNNIIVSGNDVSIAIPKGHLTYANYVEIAGCGSSGKVDISGVLITKELFIKGNCTYNLDGGIVTDKITLNTGAATVIAGVGFDEEGGAGGYIPKPPTPIYNIPESTYNHWTSAISEITNMETKR